MGWTRDTVRKVAKRTGYPVIEAWSSHNAGYMGTVYGPMLHHTGTSDLAAGDYPTLRVVRDGRPGLENSLCMYGLGRSGTIYLINEKISWHAGSGTWNGITDGNGHFAGIEAESGGAGKWGAAQLDSYKKLVASILLETGRDTNWMPTHAQFAMPQGRKTDPVGIDLARFKNDVTNILRNPSLLGEGVDDLPDINDVKKVVDESLRPVFDTLTPGIAGVKFNGDVWGKVTAVDVRTAKLEGQVAELIKLVKELAAKPDTVAASIEGMSVQEIVKAVNDEADRRDRDDDPNTGSRS